MTTHVKRLTRSIVDAARGVAGEGRSKAPLRGRPLDEKRARELFALYRVAARSALLSAEAITAVMAEAFLNAAVTLIGNAPTRRKPRRRRSLTRRTAQPQFKAGKDLVTDVPPEGGTE